MLRLCFSGLLFLLMGATLAQQDTGTLKTSVFPGDSYRIRIDGQLQARTNIFALPAGTYEIEVWAPKFQHLSDTVTIVAGEQTAYQLILPADPEWVRFRKRRIAYNRKVVFSRFVPGMMVVLGTGTALAFSNLRDARHKELVISEFEYNLGLATLEDVEVADSGFKRSNFFYTAGVITAGVGAAAFAALFPLSLKLKKPTYEQKNPFTLETFQLGMAAPDAPGFHLTMRF